MFSAPCASEKKLRATSWSDSAMKVDSSLGTKRKGAKASQNRADAILHPWIDTLGGSHSSVERVLVIDIGGRSVKILATGQMQRRSFRSGPTLTPGRMV